MTAAELISLVRHMAEKDEDSLVAKLRQTDFREQEDLDAFQSVVTALGLDEWLEDISFDLETDMKQPEEEEAEEEATQLDEMAEWVERLKYLNETQHRRG